MNGKKDSSLIFQLLEALPGIFWGFSIGCGLTTLFILGWLDRHYPYEKFVFAQIYNINRVLFIFMTAFIVIRFFWSKQKKHYLKELCITTISGGVFGYIVTFFIEHLGNLDLVNSIWGI
ncbi:MAG: hypothetical protein J6O73_07260 [Lachnospiraceae bacterium]|nr:hypothetical protein [Lachnospiraceae bacterium]